MKANLIALLLCLVFAQGFSQNFNFEHTGNRVAILNKQKIKQADSLSDIVSDKRYTNSKVDHFSAEISATIKGKTVIAKSAQIKIVLRQ